MNMLYLARSKYPYFLSVILSSGMNTKAIIKSPMYQLPNMPNTSPSTIAQRPMPKSERLVLLIRA